MPAGLGLPFLILQKLDLEKIYSKASRGCKAKAECNLDCKDGWGRGKDASTFFLHTLACGLSLPYHSTLLPRAVPPEVPARRQRRGIRSNWIEV
jgi:hypothetical protein